MAANVELIIRAVDKASQQIKATERSVKGLSNAGKEASSRTRGFNLDLAALASSAAIVGGALTGLGVAAKKAFDLSKEGAIIQQTTESFDRMNTAVFKTPDLLEDMRRASRGTIKDLDLMRGVLTLTAGQADDVAQGFAEGAPKLLEIAKAANKLNPLLGDTAFLFESLSLGIKRQSPLILDNLGLTVKVGEANEKYAQALGKSVEELTAAEKQQALFNEVLRAGDVLISQVGGNVDSAVDSYAQLETAVASLKDEGKKLLADGLTPQVRALAEAIRVNKLYADALTDSNVETKELVSAFVQASRHGLTTAEQIDVVTRAMDELAKGSELTAGELVNQMIESDRLTHAYGFLISQYQKAGIVTSDLADETKELSDEQKKLQERMDAYFDTQRRNLAGQESARRSAELLEKQWRKDRMEAGALKKEVDTLTLSMSSAANSGLSLLNEKLDQLGPKMAMVGGRTEDQNRILEQAQDEYGKLKREIDDMIAAPELFGLTVDETNEKIQDNVDRMNELLPLINRYSDITGTASFYTKNFTVNQEAVNKALVQAAMASTDVSEGMTTQAEKVLALGLALGTYNEEQAAAIAAGIELNAGIAEITEAFSNQEFTVKEVQTAVELLSSEGIEAMRDFVQDALIPAKTQAQLVADNVAKMKAQIDALPRDVVIRIRAELSGVPVDIPQSQAQQQQQQGQSTGTTTTTPQANEPDNPDKYGDFQHGGSFTVPASQDYLLGLHQGERVTITPKAQVETINRWIDRFSSSLNKADLAGGIVRYQHVLNELSSLGSSLRGMFDSFLPGQTPTTDYRGLMSQTNRRRKATSGLIDKLLGDLGLQGESTLELRRLRDTGGGFGGEYRDLFIKDVDRVLRLKNQEKALTAELLRLEERRTAEAEKQRQLEQQRQTIDFLQAQIQLIDQLQQRGLDPRDVLKGTTLGLNADPAQLAAITQTMLEAIIKQINDELKGVENRQLGGRVIAGRSYIVGESGPEYFTPGSTGQITPMGRGGSSIYIDARGANPGQVQREVEMALARHGTRAQSIQRRR